MRGRSVGANACAMGNDKTSIEEGVKVLLNVLEDFVGVNSQFLTAVFIGISFAQNGQRSLLNGCDADSSVAMMLLVFEVVAFGCYLLSSLVAKALKAHLSTYLFWKPSLFRTPRRKLLITVLLTLSIWGSIFGCLFLTLSMVNTIRILLGKTSCRGSYTFKAASSLIGIVTFALLIYITFMKLALVTLWRNV